MEGNLKNKAANLEFNQKDFQDIFIFISTNYAIVHKKTFIVSFKSHLNSHLFFLMVLPTIRLKGKVHIIFFMLAKSLCDQYLCLQEVEIYSDQDSLLLDI